MQNKKKFSKKEYEELPAPLPPHRVLREVLRHYIEFRELVGGYGLVGGGSDGRRHVIEHSYWAKGDNGKRIKETISISFWDLHRGLKELAPRKREALWYNVIEDKKQKDVARLMGITTVSVGQYVEAATLQLAAKYFDSDELKETHDSN